MSVDSSQEIAAPRFSSRLIRWFPIGLVVVEGITVAVIQSLKAAEKFPPAESFLATASSLALSGFLLFAWFVFFSPASRGTRRIVGIVGVLVIVLAVASLRLDGVSGDIHPQFAWRWSPRPHSAVPTLEQSPPGLVADLTARTPQDSPEFLGPGRHATFDGIHLARDWQAAEPRAIWRQPIGAGWSSFAVVGHYGVTQEQRNEEQDGKRNDRELITCYDLDNGQLIWAHVTPVSFEHVVAGMGPRATPTVVDGKVYALGALGHLTCLDGATGRQLWQHDVIQESGAQLPVWGKSCSPLVVDNLVIVSAGGKGGKSLLAFDRESGQLVWSAGDDQSSYSSPTLMTLAGEPQVVIVNERSVAGHDLKDGHLLWQHDWPENSNGSPNVSQPLPVGDDRILMSKGYGIGSALWQIKRDGDSWKVEELWKNNSLKTKMTSAVTRDGYAYGLDEGVLMCLEIATGKKMWKKEKFGHGQVLLVDDLLLVQSEAGEVALVEASPKAYKKLTQFQAITGKSWNYPTLSGNRLLVRSEDEAACYELPVASP